MLICVTVHFSYYLVKPSSYIQIYRHFSTKLKDLTEFLKHEKNSPGKEQTGRESARAEAQR